MIRAGAATEDVELPKVVFLAGFAARTDPASGVLDTTQARAIVLGDLALVAVDVCALHELTCEDIRRSVRPVVPECIVAATHTHAGPSCARGRVGPDQPEVERAVVAAAILAVRRASESAVPCDLRIGVSRGTGVAHDRRANRPVDPPLTVVEAIDMTGRAQARLVHFPCHPVVLDGSNTLISGDFPAVLRDSLDDDDTISIFVNGCAGDINTGHTAEDSYRPHGRSTRSLHEARRIGSLLADHARSATRRPLEAGCADVAFSPVVLEIDKVSTSTLVAQRDSWSIDRMTSDPAFGTLLETWIDWAERHIENPGRLATWSGRVGAALIGPLLLVTLPGEPFLETAERIASRSAAILGPRTTVLVLGYCDGVPGYVPHRSAYPSGGYEIVDAHRYYDMPGPFAQDSADRLEDAAVRAVHQLTS